MLIADMYAPRKFITTDLTHEMNEEELLDDKGDDDESKGPEGVLAKVATLREYFTSELLSFIKDVLSNLYESVRKLPLEIRYILRLVYMKA